MIKIHQIKVPVDKALSIDIIARKLHCLPKEISSFAIDRQSLDARGPHLHYSYTVYAQVRNEEKYLRNKDVTAEEKEMYVLPSPQPKQTDQPIIVGFGPAGMFSALILAECGLRPIIIERGRPVEERTKDIDAFFQKGELDEESNVQFGEGGAGTFSDGKLTTRMKNVRIGKVFDEFIEAGADPAISYQHRPHLGTDALRIIVKNIRQKIISLGGEIHFNTRMEDLITADHKLTGLHTTAGDFMSSHIILCGGHSASDTYQNLYRQGVAIEQKDFAAGVRVEHLQSMIDQCTYGNFAGDPHLEPASYQLTAKTKFNRGVYSFCMCPGGIVIPSSAKKNALAVNGMSYSQRNGANANSAILVQIPRKDFDHGDPLDGFRFQQELEKHAYRNGYEAPCQNIHDYLAHTVSKTPIIPTSFPRGIVMEDMHALFSEEVSGALEEGLRTFGHRIKGFDDQGIMVGMESRSSSPIRLLRTEDGCSVSCQGLYPAGEGAGYAGGIVSSAVDGIKQAENLIMDLNRD
ncbi:MAG: hypothetical protein GX478_02705 [Erysipelotrichaceae bacterium]|jgi:uncharacterized FAD-dependent dehydrogenase|nr:hypothetical protein [Erysipelotrichaceae bacterium]